MLSESVKSISYVKTHASEVINGVVETHEPVFITQNGEAKAVLLDTESYQEMINTIGILKLISLGEKDIEEGKITKNADVFRELRKTIDNG